ncbi:ImmA/IrrE family metallo-endopeptidase [Candidatus Gracilibacteria bacterium]|nr:ImmA/IrrE family metallo-endopeptidase [Candidatus Gracilibacteria bacterium]
MTVPKKVEDLLQYMQIPINIEGLILRLGFTILYKELPKHCHGLVSKSNGRISIIVNNKISLQEKRIALGHELKHILYNEIHEHSHTNDPQDIIEQEADAFSRDILIPESILRRYWFGYHTRNTRHLSSIFLVPEQHISLKIKELGFR